MLSNIRPFQIVLIGIFTFLAFTSLILLANFKSHSSPNQKAYGAQVVIWGTLPASAFDRTFQDVVTKDGDFNVVKYHQVPAASFDSALLNAIAEGNSPDMIVLPSEDLVKERSKMLPIPYTQLSERDYRNTYVNGADIFARPDGIYAIPFAVDPIVMFWNRDLLASAGLAEPPQTWDSIISTFVPKLTKRTSDLNIMQSGIAFGEAANVMHFEQILIMLATQSGSAGVTEAQRGYVVGLNKSQTPGARAPLEAALQFFTDFSNVNSPDYSWSRAMPEDQDAFVGGTLALYFGYGSEAQDISNKNPNLNFDVAAVPQGSSATIDRTYGTFYGFAIPRASKNPNGAYAAAMTLAKPQYNSELTQALNMASARRDVIAAGDSDIYRETMLQSALIAQSWLDPDPTASASIFAQMVEDVVSNRSRVSQAVSDAVNRLVLKY